ncbi:MAG: putative defective protein IntQ [Syntrophomonadaceae bacterium]|nr:putative defective protein IntQ [Bacillota bacterium]
MARGSVIKREGKRGVTYAIRYYADGCQHWEGGFPTKKEAEAALAERLRQINRGEFRPLKDCPFAGLCDRFLELKKSQIRPRTYETYLASVKQIKAYFGSANIKSITEEHVERFVASLSGYAPETQAKTIMLLKAIFEASVRWGYLGISPARFIKRPRLARREAEFLEPDEIRLLIDAVDPRHRCLIMFLCLTGCRISEALGLRWGDVDFNAGRVFIRQVLQFSRYGDRCFFSPKTEASRRAIDLPDVLIQELKTHQMRLAVELESNEYDLVFPNAVGKPAHCRNLVRRVLEPALRRAGIRRVGFHALRHSYVSLLAAQGENLKTVQALVGHSSARTTWDIYSHLFDGETKKAVSRLEERLFGENSAEVKTDSAMKDIT